MPTREIEFRDAVREAMSEEMRLDTRVYLLGGTADFLFNHFIDNALRRPLVLIPPDATAIGSRPS